MNENEDDDPEFDEESFRDFLYSIIDMTREILPLSEEQIRKLDEVQAELMEE